MKSCPTCDLVYNYELLQFCRFDGARLVDTYSGEDTTQQLLLPRELNRNRGAHIDNRTGELNTHNQLW
jgi:hypothetical protein